MTPQRMRILEHLASARVHGTAEDIYRDLHGKSPGMGRATVFRALKLFARLGLADRTPPETPRSRFEGAGKTHHDHMTCLRCGKVLEFHSPAIERLQRAQASRRGFLLVRHALELVGYCRSCRKPRDAYA
ncbi:MAG: transcriptional repressor [Elusimicrobiota bacterium]